MKYQLPKKRYHYAIEMEYYNPEAHTQPLQSPRVFEVETLKELNAKFDSLYDCREVMLTRIRLATYEEIQAYKKGYYN